MRTGIEGRCNIACFQALALHQQHTVNSLQVDIEGTIELRRYRVKEQKINATAVHGAFEVALRTNSQ